MEKTYDAISQYIKNRLPKVLKKAQSDDTPLPMPEKVLFGVVDLSRYEQKVIVTITPQSMEEDDGTSAESGQSQKFVIGIICKGRTYEVLVRQMCRYAECLAQIFRSGWSLGGKVSDLTVIRTQMQELLKNRLLLQKLKFPLRLPAELCRKLTRLNNRRLSYE